MRNNDVFPDSAKPFRSSRFGPPRTAQFTNNRLSLDVERGTYRLMGVQRSAVATDIFVLFAVTRLTAIEQFPAAVTFLTAAGEVLPLSYGFWNGAVVTAASPGFPVEVDVLAGERIVFWAHDGTTAAIKYVKVGELPPRDPEVNDNHSGAFE